MMSAHRISIKTALNVPHRFGWKKAMNTSVLRCFHCFYPNDKHKQYFHSIQFDFFYRFSFSFHQFISINTGEKGILNKILFRFSALYWCICCKSAASKFIYFDCVLWYIPSFSILVPFKIHRHECSKRLVHEDQHFIFFRNIWRVFFIAMAIATLY